MDELEISGKRYISARRAAKEHHYHSDYIGQLIRAKKIKGTKVGRSWYVEEASLDAYIAKEQGEAYHGPAPAVPEKSKEAITPIIKTVPVHTVPPALPKVSAIVSSAKPVANTLPQLTYLKDKPETPEPKQMIAATPAVPSLGAVRQTPYQPYKPTLAVPKQLGPKKKSASMVFTIITLIGVVIFTATLAASYLLTATTKYTGSQTILLK